MNAHCTLSVVLIVRDEAPRLRRLLPRLDWADEIIVVDDCSRDDSLAVAQAHGAITVRQRLQDFAAQRNAGLALARGEWVLSLDADECPTAECVAAIERVLHGARHDAYRVRIRSVIFGRRFWFSGTQDDRPVRLFRRSRARWVGAVHERLVVSGAIGDLPGVLDHQTIPDVRVFRRKACRYTRLEAIARRRNGQLPWRGERWWAAARETLRRLIWKHGWLDGPEGIAFALLSGWSAWLAVDRTRRLFDRPAATVAPVDARSPEEVVHVG